MGKNLGIVDPGPPPVDPFKDRSAAGLGVVQKVEASVKQAAATPLGPISNAEVVVTVSVAPPDPIGQLRQVMAAPPTPPPPPAPVGVVEQKTPIVSAIPINPNVPSIGIIRNIVAEMPAAPPPPAVGSVIKDPPIFPPPPPPARANVGEVTQPVVSVQTMAPSNEPQKVVSLTVKPRPIIEQPVEISPLRPDGE
jgi:hypothetical protein